MTRLRAQIWGGVFMTAACLAVGVPVAVVHFQGGRLPSIPSGLWLAVFAAFAAAFCCTMWLMESARRPVLLGTLAAQAALAPVLVLTAPASGWTPILLVFNAAIGAYLLPPRVMAVLVAANTAVVAAATALVSASPFEIGMVAGLYLMLQAASVLGVHAHLRETQSRKRIAEAHVRLRAASALLAEASRVEERLRIARELHDLVGHQLTVLALELEIASHRIDGAAAEPVDRAKAVAHGLLADVRAAVGEIREGGPRLRELVEDIVAELPEPAVHLRIEAGIEVGEAHTRVLVRCVQEVVTNAIRHAGAENLWIDIGAEGGLLTFEARDDGVGARTVEIGHGLRGMAERLAALGGKVRFCGDDGFRVRAEVPAA